MIDLRALGRDYGFPVIDSGHHHCHEGWLQTHCPFCSPGRGFHLGMSMEKGNFHCWRCGSLRAWDVLAKLVGNTASTRAAWGKYQTESYRAKPTLKPRRKTVWAPPGMGPMGRQHRRYLRSRGLDPDKLEEEWGLVGTEHLSKAWNWRIIFPIRNRQGRIIAYGGRAITNHTRPKYRLPKDSQMGEDPKSLLYGIHQVEGDAVVIVEGPADVWRLGPGAVALWGVSWNVEQTIQLKDFSRRFIMLDPDPAGQRKAEGLARWLGMYSGETEIIEGLPSDPGALPQGEADQIMRELVHE